MGATAEARGRTGASTDSGEEDRGHVAEKKVLEKPRVEEGLNDALTGEDEEDEIYESDGGDDRECYSDTELADDE